MLLVGSGWLRGERQDAADPGSGSRRCCLAIPPAQPQPLWLFRAGVGINEQGSVMGGGQGDSAQCLFHGC